MKIEDLEKILKDVKTLYGNIEVKVGLSEESLEDFVRFADGKFELKFDDVDFFEDIDGKVIRILA